MRRLVIAVTALALVAAEPAFAARFAVGARPGVSLAALGERVERATGRRVERDGALRAIFVNARTGSRLRALAGVSYVERLSARRRISFTPNDPMLARQWYLFQTKAFDFWLQPPPLGPPVKVAVIDSGVDGRHPELARRIVAAKSFVGGSALDDQQGHGTFVAGEIAAATGNGQGIAGMAFPAKLLVAKVVRSDRSIPLEAEAKAIRWAVDNGAHVINLSLSGVRDPRNARRDSYSPVEASAVAYAHRKGVLVVAAVGNADQAPATPWEYAGWPAALPHVVSVSALARDGSVPMFSNRDEFYNDIVAPGEDILSILPRQLTAKRPSCGNQGYSDCGPAEYRHAEGTSFAAPQVSAAAALLLSVKPSLRPDQIANILTRTAVDATQYTGCKLCGAGRDALTGWGRLDVQRALMQASYSAFPDVDRYETNDDAGSQAWRFWGSGPRQVTATLDFWDDQVDVYSVKIARGQKLRATLRGPLGAETKLLLWKPGTKTVEGLVVPKTRVAESVRTGTTEMIRNHRAAVPGWYYLQVKMVRPGSGEYTLSYSKG